MKAKDEMISLYSLVPEITGLTPKHPDFEANYKLLQRVLKNLRKLEGVEGEGTKIHVSKKERYVNSMKKLLNNPEYYEMIKRMIDGENFTREEYEKMIGLQTDCITEGQSEKTKKTWEEINDLMLDNATFEKIDEIRATVLNHLQKISDIDDIEIRMEYLNKYQEFIENQSKNLLTQVEAAIYVEYIKKSHNYVSKMMVGEITDQQCVYTPEEEAEFILGFLKRGY